MDHCMVSESHSAMVSVFCRLPEYCTSFTCTFAIVYVKVLTPVFLAALGTLQMVSNPAIADSGPTATSDTCPSRGRTSVLRLATFVLWV